MAVLEHLATGTLVHLGPRHQVGRSASAQLRLQDPRVSGAHALVAYTERGWTLRDLGSRNGTWHEGRRLDPGEEVELRTGAILAFGSADDGWRVLRVPPPSGMATEVEGGQVVPFRDGLLALPGEDDPRLVVTADGSGGFLAEDERGVRPVEEGAIVLVDGRAWRLSLPRIATETVGEGDSDVSLRLAVSRDEEHVEVTVLRPSKPLVLPSRAHHYLLLQLARQRLQDAPIVPPSEVGWLAQEDVIGMLRISMNALYQQVHRARRELLDRGVVQGARVVERRRDAGQLRLGLPAEVVRL